MKNATIIILGSALILLFTNPLNSQTTSEDNALKTKINNFLNEGVANGFSGSVLIAKEGEIILHKGFGMADRENDIPYSTSTVSTIGSVTKQFTATAILKLEMSNKLKVTDPISLYFKKLPNDKKNITIHQLLTHSSGLVDEIGDGDFDDIPMKRFFNTLFETELLFKPGTKYSYSNAGYSILARIIELVSEQEYENFLNENLFKPAGMLETGYLIPNWVNNSMANGYERNLVNVGTMIARYRKMGKITWTLKGNGGILSTTSDMFKWYQALKTNKILSKSMIEKLTTPYILENGGNSSYAYGWAIYNSDRDTKTISHNGGNGIFFHDYIWLPEEDVVVLLFTNASSTEVEVAWTINKMIFDKTYKPDPIKKNLFYYAFDFMQHNEVEQSNELILTFKKEYIRSIQRPYVLNGLGYKILKNEIININENEQWALSIFKLNSELFPKEGNTWDSLGEAYMKYGQKNEAIQSYKKALQLASDDNCDWCKSSKDALKILSKGE